MVRPESPIRTVIVGYGLSGRRIHAPLLNSQSDYSIAGVIARSESLRSAAAAEQETALVMADFDELVDHAGEFDLVVVATPDDSHVEFARAALDAGLHVLVDKPLATSSSDAVDLYRRAESRGLVLTAFQNKRWDADFLTVRHAVQNSLVGPVTRFDSWISGWDPVVSESWRETKRPGTVDGRLADLGSHLVDQAVSLFGQVARVYAELDERRVGTHANDDVFLALTHENGVRTHVHLGSVTSHEIPTFQLQGLNGHVITRGKDGQFMAALNGFGPLDSEWRSYDSWDAELSINGQTKAISRPTGDWRDLYVNLADAIHGRGRLAIEPNEVVHVLRVLESARWSHDSGRVAPVQE